MIESKPVTMFHVVCDLCKRRSRYGAPVRTQALVPEGWVRFDVTHPENGVKTVCVCKHCLDVIGVE